MISNDGCSSLCSIEVGYDCSDTPSKCIPKCGDSLILYDECDDGNLIQKDGCSDECKVEEGWFCSGEPSSCMSICGDGIIIEGKEECED